MKKCAAVLLMCVLLFSGCIARENPQPPPASDSGQTSAWQEEAILAPLTVTVLDLGKADSILVEVNRHAVLIDTGEEDDGPKIKAFLADRGINHLDVLILTHLDKDHIGGAAQVIGAVSIGRVIQSRNTEKSDAYKSYQAACEAKGIVPERLMEPQDISIEEASFRLIPGAASSYTDDNDYSIMTQLAYGEKRFLFAGDAEAQRLREYLADNPVQPVDFLKVPHHGRSSDFSAAFLQAVRPGYAVITCSKKNPPDEEVLTLLEQSGARILLTSQGYITAVCDGKSIQVEQHT